MSESEQSRFSDVATPELTEYKPLSLLAIIGMLASLVGIIAAFQPWLFAIPTIAAVMCSVAIVVASRPDAQTSGRPLAACGLLLSLFLIGFAAATSYSRTQHLHDVARPLAESWLHMMLDGRFKEAHQLMLEEADRDEGNLDVIYATGEMESQMAMREAQNADSPGAAMAEPPAARREQMETFLQMPTVEKLRKLTPEATVTFLRDELIRDSSSQTTISETFTIQPGDGPVQPFEITLILERNDYGDHGTWHVSSMQ